MKLRALIFDVDGTLAETEETHRQAFNAVFAAHRVGWTWSIDDYRRLLKITGGKERMAAFRNERGAGPDDAEIAALHAEKTAEFTRIVAGGGLTARPGVLRLIDDARMDDIALAVATTTSPANVDALTRSLWQRPAAEVFQVIAAGDEVAAKKPAPDVYLLALHRLALGPHECLALEDSLNGVRAARAAGIAVVATPSLYTAHEDLSASALVLPDLSGFTLPLARALISA